MGHPHSHSTFPDWHTAADWIVDVGQRAALRQWVPATAGNFSVRANDGTLAITRTGVDKGRLTHADLLRQPVDGALLPGSSAEAGLHLPLYAQSHAIGAVFHTHNPSATLLGRLHLDEGHSGAFQLEGWELQKALHGVRSHTDRVDLPVFANSQDIPALAAEVTRCFSHTPADAILAPGYVIAGHGLYAWGRDAREAWRHLEALDTLLSLSLALQGRATIA